MGNSFHIFPIGIIKKKKNRTTIEIYKKYEDALLGLNQFSHIIVFSWFHENDTAEKRRTLQVYPQKNSENPLTGVFATRSPVRPNLIAISTCKILSIAGNLIHIDKIDAFDGTPVIDIKPSITTTDMALNVKVPKWVEDDCD